MADAPPASPTPSRSNPNVDSPPKAILKGRLSDLLARIDDLTCQISDYSSSLFQEDMKHLAEVKCDLFDVELTLQAANPTDTQYKQVCATLKSVQIVLDQTHQRLAGRSKFWESWLAIYASVLLISAAVCGYWLYINKVAPAHGLFRHVPLSWPLVRLALLACSGAVLGGASDLMRILSVVLANKSLDPRRVLWYFLFPLASAGLAGAFYLLIQAGTGFAAVGAGKTVAGAAGVFGLGFLIGFVPTAVIYRINQVVKAFFGTDEVSSPVVAPPQVVRISNSSNGARLRVTANIQSSDAVRIVSAVARLQMSGETQVPGGTASAVMRRGMDNTWVGEVLVPSNRKNSDSSAAASDEGKGTLTVEARDDAGGIGRSEAVSLPPLQSEEGAGPDANSADASSSSSSGSSAGSSGSSSSGDRSDFSLESSSPGSRTGQAWASTGPTIT